MKLTTYLDLDKSCYHICLCGELDACSSLLLDEAINKAIRKHPSEISVDCQALYYISSAGLGVFISYLQTLSAENISLVLHNLTPAVKSTFDCNGVLSFAPRLSQNKYDLVLDKELNSGC
jgi:anti-sigma B factor antagonist